MVEIILDPLQEILVLQMKRQNHHPIIITYPYWEEFCSNAIEQEQLSPNLWFRNVAVNWDTWETSDKTSLVSRDDERIFNCVHDLSAVPFPANHAAMALGGSNFLSGCYCSLYHGCKILLQWFDERVSIRKQVSKNTCLYYFEWDCIKDGAMNLNYHYWFVGREQHHQSTSNGIVVVHHYHGLGIHHLLS